jgi:hypothetical protein
MGGEEGLARAEQKVGRVIAREPRAESDPGPQQTADVSAEGETATDESASGVAEVAGGSESSSANPLGEHLDFSLSVPTIEVRMVNAASLEDYEIWFLVSSLVSSAAIGFLVAYMQSFQEDAQGVERGDGTFLVVALIFCALMVLCVWRAITLRRRITSESKTYQMRASASKPAKEPKADS